MNNLLTFTSRRLFYTNPHNDQWSSLKKQLTMFYYYFCNLAMKRAEIKYKTVKFFKIILKIVSYF